MATHRYFITSVTDRIQALQAIAKLYKFNNLVEAAIHLPKDAAFPLELQGVEQVPFVVHEVFGTSAVIDVQTTYDKHEMFYIEREKRIKIIQEWYNSLDPETQKKVQEYANLSGPFA